MDGSRWMGYADEAAQDAVGFALRNAGYDGDVVFLDSPEQLRASVALDGLGVANVVVGHVSEGVSDVNLAAAIVQDHQARRVFLVRDKASGSLRSRARRAGIADVLDPFDITVESEGAGGPSGADGGPAGTPAPSSGLVHVGPSSIASHPERVRGQGAPVLVFCSGRGGSGTSSIAVVTAALAASWGMSVGVVDLDLACGNAYSYLGLRAGCDLAGLGSASGDLPMPPGVSVGSRMRLWGPCDLPENAELAMPHVGELVSRVSSACDLVIVDTSTTFTDAVAQAAQMCDRLVLVSDDRPGSLAALSRMAGLAVRLGVARTRIVRISNRADPRTKADLSLGRAEVGLETARIYRVFESDELPELLSLGQVEAVVGIHAEFTQSVAYFLANVLSEMGRLPDCRAAEQALKTDGSRRGWGIFGRRREVG